MRMPTPKQWRAYYLCDIIGNRQREAGSAMSISQQMVSKHLQAIRVKLPMANVPDSAINTTMPKFLSYDPSMDYGVRHQF